MPQEERELDYNSLLSVINFIKAAKQLLGVIKIETLDNLENDILQAKINETMKGKKVEGGIIQENTPELVI